MNPLGPGRAWERAIATPRPSLLPLGRGGGSGGTGGSSSAQRRSVLGGGAAAAAAAAAGMTSMAGMAKMAAGGLPPLAAGAMSPRGGRGGGGLSGPLPGEFGDPARRATDVLLVGNVLLFGLQLLTRELVTVWGIKINALIVAGQWWRLLTPAFLHGNLMHLVVNSYSLNNLGPTVERTAGSGRFLLMYLAAAVAGNVASFYGSTAPSLGASGAIFGIGGALAMYYYRNKDIHGRRSEIVLRSLWQTLLMNVLYGLSNPRIDNWGHMGGMVGGALAALLLGPRWKIARLPGKRGTWLVDDAPLPWFRSQPRLAS